VLLSSGDSFPDLIQKRRSQLGSVTYLLNYPRTYSNDRRLGRTGVRVLGECLCTRLEGVRGSAVIIPPILHLGNRREWSISGTGRAMESPSWKTEKEMTL
jgi:hypothetical protein